MKKCPIYIYQNNNIIIKMSRLSKHIYRFYAIPIKIPMTFSTERDTSILKFYESQSAQVARNNCRKNTAEGITFPAF